MKELSPLDYELLFELMTNSRRSDRALAKVLKSSQPTITRKRVKLEREVIEGYTAVPRWKKLGYEIFAMTLVKSKTALATKEKYEIVRNKGMEWLMNQSNVIMAGGCRGEGVNAFMISIHKNYSDYDEFMYKYRLELGATAEDVKTVLVSLAGRELLKPLHFKYLAESAK